MSRRAGSLFSSIRTLPTARPLAALSNITLPVNPAMPKVTGPALPLNGIFPIEKPSGPTSMRVIDDLTLLMLDSKLFADESKVQFHKHKNKRKKNTTAHGLKVGQGGTLDPLADGVLGVNRGTKYLQQYLEGTKEYESIGILGASTTTMDAEGPVLSTGDFDNVTREDIEKALEKFQGEIYQTPPIFSALKMEGKPLYEYARANQPLPRPIPVRKCKVSVELLEFTPASKESGDGGHEYSWPKERLSEEEKDVFRDLTHLVEDSQKGVEGGEPALPTISAQDLPEVSAKTGLKPPTFKIRMTVSGGTYVRSIVHDLGIALGCGAHVVMLRRTRQGRFVLHGNEGELTDEAREEMQKAMNAELANVSGGATGAGRDVVMEDDIALKGEKPTSPGTGCVPWSVLEKALKERAEVVKNQDAEIQERLEAEGADAAQIKEALSKEGKRMARMEGPLREWEHEVLRRFISVPVPSNGGHRTTPY